MIKLIFIIIALVVTNIVTLYFTTKSNKKNKEYSNKIKELEKSQIKVEENIKNANDQKQKINTGNPVDDFNNSINIMSQHSKKRK